jgi:hypothetical protein
VAVQSIPPFAVPPPAITGPGLSPDLLAASPLPAAIDVTAPALLLVADAGQATSVEFAWPESRQFRLVSLFLLILGWALLFALPHWFDAEQIGIALIVGGLVVTMAAAIIPLVKLCTRSWSAMARVFCSCAVTLAASAALTAALLAVSL